MSILPGNGKIRTEQEKMLREDLIAFVQAELEKLTGKKLYVKVQTTTVIYEPLMPMGEKFGFHIVVTAHPKEDKKEEDPK